MKNYYRSIGTRAECGPAIGGLILLIVLSFLIYHFRDAVLTALEITALGLLAVLAIYTAAAVTVAARRHRHVQAMQAAPEPKPAPNPEPVTSFADVLPPRDVDTSDLEAASGVTADGQIV